MNTTKKIIIFFLLSVIIILIIIYLCNKHSPSSLREGFISQYYRPYYRKIKRGISGYLKKILNY